jgi:hypothetical protein
MRSHDEVVALVKELQENGERRAIVGPCATCGLDDVCADHRGKPYCHDCWHAARYQETPYAVFREADNYCLSHGSKLKEEAEAHAARMTAEEQHNFEVYKLAPANDPSDPNQDHYAQLVAHDKAIGPGWRTYVAKPCQSWFGDRIAHPAYMIRRRAAVIAAHPEYGP